MENQEEDEVVLAKVTSEVEDNFEDEGLVSNSTLEKVAAAKKYIENHYNRRMRHIQQRKERRWVLEQKIASLDVSEKEQLELLEDLQRKETEYTRLMRNRLCVDDFDLLSIIGRGAFGEVRLCREKKTGNIYAMKKLKKSEMLSRGQVEHVRAERNLLAEVASDCIVKLYYSFQDPEYLYLIMEYLSGGDVMTLLMREETLTETVARFYIAQSVLAIESIHKHNYVHRDIKPDNLLLDKYGHMKLSDFGLCKPLDCRNISAMNVNEPLNDENINESIDGDENCSIGRRGRRWKSPLEQLQHWQINRRKLAYSTVGTPDYIAPEVLSICLDGEGSGLDYAAVTVQLPGGERVPFLFTVKQLEASGKPESFSGKFLVPSYRGSSFLDPKGRGGSTGYDNAVALPAGGRGDEEELSKENVKNTAASVGEITLKITKSKPETGEVIGVFESLQPSDTDLGAKVPKDVKIQGVWYGQIE